MLHRIFALAAASLLLGGASGASATTITIFDGSGPGELRSDWEAAVFDFILEDYNDNTSDDFSITFNGSGHDQIPIVGTGSVVDAGLLGALIDRLAPADDSSTVFEFDFPILGFGADWNLAINGSGLGIEVEAGGTVLSMEIPNTHNGDFWGFVTDMPFTTVTLTAGSQGGVFETYLQDDVVYAVPEPSAATAFVFGLGAVGCAVRRRQLS